MDSDQIVSKMNSYLHASATALAKWLGKYLPRTSEDWWEECVIERLSYNQKEMARQNGITELGQFDLAALLRIADKNWCGIRNVVYLHQRERECIKDMMRVRNNWAHVSATLPGKDAILADLETLHKFFEQRECDISLIDDVDRTIEEVKSHSTVDFESLAREDAEKSEEPAAQRVTVNEDEIREKSQVYLISEPETRGIVMSVTDMGDTRQYEVFVNGVIKKYYSGQIALYAETASYNWVDARTFRSYLTAYLINNPSGNDLYSLNSARIDFVPYQFRPALKLIHADEPRILIADSVGVGKTIEAGLIIKELQARRELKNILIICPKPLVAERKWEMEMKRFDEEFVPVDGPTLRQIISDTDRDGEWPERYSRAIVPYSIFDSRAYLGEKTKRKSAVGLSDLEPRPHFDLVIVDEAHHIRNGSMEKEKAFEYKCTKYFCDNAEAVVMLTATPLQTGDDDLFTLLNVLRPDVVIDRQTFDMMSKPNAYISKAARIIRRADADWQKEAMEALRGVLETQWGENVIAANPTYAKMARTLGQDKITREDRVRLISDAESLHSFNFMLSRTRRRDIQDFCIRRPHTLAVEFTSRQRELHDELLCFEQAALMQLHGDAKSIPFMMTTIKRQAASCIFGLAPYVRDLVRRRFNQLGDDPDLDQEAGFLFEGEDATALENLAHKLLEMADNLPDEDPKFEKMMEAVRKKQKQPNNKIIIFSTFRHTLEYVRRKLLDAGFRVAQVDGGVKDAERQELRERFELPKGDGDALDIMLFTEVGSEGLDYQFCDMMINYDLPWNPMKIEQRIGRIDRRGQRSEAVGIYNMITNGTVDADIYYSCLNRIGIFESSVGECEEIFGEIATKIDGIAMDPTLTGEERRRKLEQMADNEVREMQELNLLEEEEKELFGIDISEQMTSQEIRNAENPWLSQRSLQILVEQYLAGRLGQGTYIKGDGDAKNLRLAGNARAKLRDDFRKLDGQKGAVCQSWDKYLKGASPNHLITFDQEMAEKRRDAFFITPMHPLAKQAAAYFASSESAYIKLRHAADGLSAGEHRFCVYAWSYVGLNPRFRLVTVCDDDAIAAELPDILEESQNADAPVGINSSDWDDLERKHVALWKDAKSAEIKDAENRSAFKIESLSNNFNSRKRSLERKMMDAVNENIRKMYAGELESATEEYERKAGEMRKKVEQTDIHTTLIANGILDVVN